MIGWTGWGLYELNPVESQLEIDGFRNLGYHVSFSSVHRSTEGVYYYADFHRRPSDFLISQSLHSFSNANLYRYDRVKDIQPLSPHARQGAGDVSLQPLPGGGLYKLSNSISIDWPIPLDPET